MGFEREVLNWDKYEKVGDCIDIDKKYWKVIKEFDKKELWQMCCLTVAKYLDEVARGRD